jgi:hypothetical protein
MLKQLKEYTSVKLWKNIIFCQFINFHILLFNIIFWIKFILNADYGLYIT